MTHVDDRLARLRALRRRVESKALAGDPAAPDLLIRIRTRIADIECGPDDDEPTAGKADVVHTAHRHHGRNRVAPL